MKLFSLLAAIILSFSLSTVAGAATTWENADGKSCDVVCSSKNMTAVTSGIYTNGNPFYVCSGSAGEEGFRAGYNLRPNWSNVCYVGWGGKETAVKFYKCLCE